MTPLSRIARVRELGAFEKDAAARLAARLRAMFADTGHSQVIDGHRWWSLSLQNLRDVARAAGLIESLQAQVEGLQEAEALVVQEDR